MESNIVTGPTDSHTDILGTIIVSTPGNQLELA